MHTKKERREAAQKRAKRKRIALLATAAAVLVTVITAAIIYAATRPDARVFAIDGGQTVRLYENGRFSARLFHNMNLSGTFTESESEGVTIVAFTQQGGTTVSAQIADDVLILPVQWRATCRVHNHEISFPLVR